ncbi:MAG: metallophosphoesterase [Bacteriovoracaceae bacterium]|nr:metallophosphoesterase [Bacteriovoracaceae bacterium]
MSTRFITTDIHGHFETFMALCKKVIAETGLSEDEFYSLLTVTGDLIDRGCKGRKVVDFCMEKKVHVVMGNHEKMLIDFSTGQNMSGPDYMKNGGRLYFSEFGSSDEEMDEMNEQIEWMKRLPYIIPYPEARNEDGRILVVSHSWLSDVDFMVPLTDIEKDKLIWNRPYSRNGGKPFEDGKISDIPGLFNVFGHCYLQEPEISKWHANLDGGVFATAWAKENKTNPLPGLDKLNMLQFPEMNIWSQETID